MAEKKMTRKDALTIAIDAVADEEAREVLTKMLEQVSKPRKKSDEPSKAFRENSAKANEIVGLMREHGAPVSQKWIREHVTLAPNTPQKCTAVMKIVVDAGIVTREKQGKETVYALVDAD